MIVNIFTGLMVFLSGSLKLWGASPTGSSGVGQENGQGCQAPICARLTTVSNSLCNSFYPYYSWKSRWKTSSFFISGKRSKYKKLTKKKASWGKTNLKKNQIHEMKKIFQKMKKIFIGWKKILGDEKVFCEMKKKFMKWWKNKTEYMGIQSQTVGQEQ